MQERDAERRRQLRERARQLIAEARSGVKMSEMSLLDTSGAERGKSSRTSPVAGQHTSPRVTNARQSAESYVKPLFWPNNNIILNKERSH